MARAWARTAPDRRQQARNRSDALTTRSRAASNPTVRIAGADEVMRAATPYVDRVALEFQLHDGATTVQPRVRATAAILSSYVTTCARLAPSC